MMIILIKAMAENLPFISTKIGFCFGPAMVLIIPGVLPKLWGWKDILGFW